MGVWLVLRLGEGIGGWESVGGELGVRSWSGAEGRERVGSKEWKIGQ